MTPKDLSPIMRKAYNALNSVEEKEAFLEQYSNLYEQRIRGAVSQVFARNFSHNVGTHLLNIY